MPSVIKFAGRARIANVDGETVERQDVIFVPSEKGWFHILETYDHFCYYNRRKLGATMMCTCGGIGNIYGFEAYSRFQSKNVGRVIACMSLIETGKHSDGTTG